MSGHVQRPGVNNQLIWLPAMQSGALMRCPRLTRLVVSDESSGCITSKMEQIRQRALRCKPQAMGRAWCPQPGWPMAAEIC